MSMEEILKNSQQMIYDKDMSDNLFQKHFDIFNFENKQRRGLGIPEEYNYEYQFDNKSPGWLDRLWNPKPKLWM